MNHDITHCKGIGCPIKEGCIRYKAHKERPENGELYLPYTTEMYDHGECPMYVRCESEYNGITRFNNRKKND